MNFWAHVALDSPDKCWEWVGCRVAEGYGRFGVNGRTRYAHRVAWELENGPIPDGLCVCHHCDNPPCVNPAHLFLGTHVENVADRHAKGRDGRLPRLSPTEVVAIRASGLRAREVAPLYPQVSLRTLFRVLGREGAYQEDAA